MIKLAQAFQIGRHFVLGEAVGFAEPSEQAAFCMAYLVAQSTVGEFLIAIKFNVFDGGGFTFIDGQFNFDTVAV